jgi:CO/xanthine dehydrogenase FAD-binding subunit
MRHYSRPQSIDEAMVALGSGQARILAGGTDIYPASGQNLDGEVLDITAISCLSGLNQSDGLRIGACTTWSDIAAATLPQSLLALQQAARQIGGRQIQNMATIGGNLCNASPAADGVPPLLALDAQVELMSPRGTRLLALSAFLLGPRKTARAPDELLTAILLPQAALQGRSHFVKLGARAYLVISIAMVAARITFQGNQICQAAIAVGSCAGTALRLPAAEAALIGASASQVADRLAGLDLAAPLAPITDIRASADYRREAAAELVHRAVQGALPC